MKTRTRAAAAAAAAAGALAAFAAPAPAAVTVGHSGWDWGNPLPQGNTLRGIEFAGLRGYAAGDFGTVLRTDDGGATWRGLPTGITSDLARLRVIDADTLIVGGGCTVRRSDNGGTSFTRLPITASEQRCNVSIAALAFPSDQIGYLVLDDGTVLRTADGGRTTARRTAVPGTSSAGGDAKPTDVVFLDADTGVASTSAATGGKIYRTTDGGSTWSPVETQPKAFNGLAFASATTGYAVGRDNTLFKSNDGGATWFAKPLSLPAPANLTSIRCADAATCLISTERGDQLLRTTDGGDTVVSLTPSTSKVFAGAFASATRVAAVGESGTTVVSDNAGTTFTTVGSRLVGELSGLRATGATAYAFGDNGALARTTDGGKTWASVGVSTSENVADVSFPSALLGYALDSEGTLLKTDNGGASWSILNTGTAAKPEAVLALDANTVLLVGPTGMRRSTNGGGEFVGVRGRLVNRARLAGIDRAGSTLFAWGASALIVSSDKGKTWAKVPRPTKDDLDSVEFVSARAGFALLGNGRLFETRNRGRRWTEVLGIGTERTQMPRFASATKGYLALHGFGGNSRSGFLLRTSDGGRTWRPQLVSSDPITALAAPGGGVDYALAESAALFATTTGGDAGASSTLTLSASKRSLRKPGRVKISGRLRPAEGGEQVVLGIRGLRNDRVWDELPVTVAANGTFTVNRRISQTTVFVVQWSGDDERNGDGSDVLTVRVR